MLDRQSGYSLRFVHRWVTFRQIRFPERVNTGLTFLNRDAYDLDFIEWCLSRPEFRHNDFTVEQTCWAALAGQINSRVWSKNQVVIPNSSSTAGLPSETTALHFISPVRHLYHDFSNVYPELVDAHSSEPICLITCSPTYSSFGEAFVRRLKKRLPNKIWPM